ncbi:MAG: flagellar biosynthesis anti-sigma factor FlgM [Thermodesulfobacteriota bacterium]|nr:flagellar biosynthesis anti-sigma factor FlgM [Thermodesulfobacteriota bacterium]
MTMRIDGDKSLIQQKPVQKARQQQQGATESAKTNNADKVSFSAVLQQAGQTKNVATPALSRPVEGLTAPLLNTPTYVQDVAETQETERAGKIEELKLQVAEGSYQPDLKKVATSLLTFIAQGRQV